MSKNILIFGSSGGIGAATKSAFLKAKYAVIAVNRGQINFTNANSDKKIQSLLSIYNPDIIINCAGHFADNKETHNKTMDVNVGSNWSIIRYYMENPPATPVKIIMVGSSACRAGRKDYILYAASKSALYNLWQGVRDYFVDTNVLVGLINPVRTRTKMIDMLTTSVCLEPEDVAKEILNMASTQTSECVDMEYPKEN